MSWFSDWTHPGDPSKDSQEQLEKYYNEGKGIQQPFVNNANESYTGLKDMYGKLMDPAKLQSEWANNYQESPYAKQMQAEAQSGGMDAASAMGLGGSSAALSNIQKGSADIMQKDRQNYMNDLMQKYMGAIGIGQNTYNQGVQTAGNMGNQANQMGQNSAQNKFNQSSAGGNMFGGLMGTAAGIAGSVLGPVGTALGGAAGTWLGNKLGNK